MHVLVTRRLTLRPPLDVDANAIARLLADARVARNLTGVPSSYTVDDARAWIAGEVEDHSAGCTFTIHRNTLIGAVGVRPRGEGHDLGFWLAPDLWGQGLMSEAGRAVLAHAFRQLGIDRITSGAFEDNIASLRVLEKLGFDMTSHESMVSPTRGTAANAVRMALSRTTFEAKFGALETERAA